MGPETFQEHVSSKEDENEVKKVEDEGHNNTSPADQLIKKEERETGDTGMKPYIDYLSHKKGFLYFTLSTFAYIIFLVAQILQSLWIATYISSTSISRLKLVIVYSGIGIGMMFLLLTRSFLVVYLGLEASESIFYKLMSSLFRAPMAFYDSTPVGRILSRVSSKIYSLQTMLLE